MLASWSCNKHKGEAVSFVCTGNIWHFEPLCNICVPEHTKNHPKNVKVQMESIKDVFNKTSEIKGKVCNIYQERLQSCEQLIKITDNQLDYFKSLNQKRTIIIQAINQTFQNIINDIKKRRAEEDALQQQNMKRLKQNLSSNIEFLKKEQYPDVNEFCRQIKKYYLKQNMQVYVEEVDEVINQFQDKRIKWNPFLWAKDLENKSKMFVKDQFKLEDASTKKDKIDKADTLNKKQPKKKEVGRKRCGKCKEEMQYLTELKKHLVCKNCDVKQRNYAKRV